MNTDDQKGTQEVVLLIEDESEIASFLIDLLALIGVKIVCLPTGEENLVREALKSYRIVGVLQDWAGTSRGPDNCRLYASEYPNLPVCIISAGPESVIRFILRQSAIGEKYQILTKPFLNEALLSLVATWRDSHEVVTTTQ